MTEHTTPPLTGAELDRQRELFEQEANAARFFPAEINFARTKSPSGRDEYANGHLQSRWEGWQAAVIAQARAQQAGAAPSEMMRAALLNIRDYRTDVADDVAAPSMRFYAQMALEQIDATPPAPMCHAPECGMCKDSGIVGFPPDQYEGCPDCIKARSIAPSDATGKDDAANAGGMEDRITKLRAALRQISETSFGWDGDCGVTKIADDALYADEQTASPATSASDAKDSARLDFLDTNVRKFRMGWEVGAAPVGNLSVRAIIMGGSPIREAIDAAMAAAPSSAAGKEGATS